MSLRKAHTNLKSILVAISVLIVSIILMYISEKTPSIYPIWRSVILSIGSALLTSVAVAVLWDLYQKRLFRIEAWDNLLFAENLQQSGIDRVIYRFEEIDWAKYFDGCTELDFFASYARSWRGSNETRMRELANSSKAKIRIVLPDPDNRYLVKQLSIRFQKTEVEIERLIREAIVEFTSIFGSKKCRFDIRLTVKPPTNAYYRFSEKRIVTLYNYREHKSDIPVILLKKPGRLTDLFDNEFEHLFVHGRPA